MERQKYEVLLFDVDGTLLDFAAAERDGLRAVLAARRIEMTEEMGRGYHEINKAYWAAFERGEISRDKIMGSRFKDFFQTLGKDVDGDAMESMYREQLDSSAVLIPDAMEVCERLRRNYRMYIVTNGVSTTQYKRLKASGLDRFFDDVFVSEDAKSQKPQKEFFEYCFSKMPSQDLDKGKMLIIGDSLTSDIRGGIEAGIDTCWYNPTGAPREDGIDVTYEITDLRKLLEIL